MGERRELVFAAREEVGVDRRAREATVSDHKVFNDIEKIKYFRVGKRVQGQTKQTYRVIFLTGPTQKYGTGPTQ